MKRKIKNTFVVLKEQLGDIHLDIDEMSQNTVVSLIHIFEKNISDQRVNGRCVYNLHNLIVIMFLALLSGYSNTSEFCRFCQLRYLILEKLGLVSGKNVPSHDTFRRVLLLIDPSELGKAIAEELDSFFNKVEKLVDDEGKFIQLNIDGKTLRGTGRGDNTNQPVTNFQTLNVYNLSRKLCIYSVGIEEKTNEIPVAQELLKLMDLKKHIISADALHSQVKTAQIINDRGGFYLFNIKNNQSSLRTDMEKRLEKNAKKIVQITVEYNKTDRIFEFLKLPKLMEESEWINQRYYVRYYNNTKDKPLYFLTSLKDKDAICEAIINRWKIENELHRDKDLLLEEDSIRYINRNISNNLTILNNMVLAFINVTKEFHKLETTKFTRKVLISEGHWLPFKTIKLIGSKNLSKYFKK